MPVDPPPPPKRKSRRPPEVSPVPSSFPKVPALLDFDPPSAPAAPFPPSEVPTKGGNRAAGDWRQLLSVFDELEPPFKDGLVALAHALLKIQIESRSSE